MLGNGEGSETVRVLLEQSSNDATSNGNIRVQIRSIFTNPLPFFEDPVKLKKTLETRFLSFQNIPFALIVGQEKAISKIIGFHLSRGALAYSNDIVLRPIPTSELLKYSRIPYIRTHVPLVL